MQQKKDASSSSSFARDAFAGQNTSDRPPLVGKEIQRLRQEHRLTLDELASKSGVSKSILSQIERDHSNPTLSTIWRISQALKQPLVDMLSSGEEKPRFEHLKVNQTPVVSSTDGKFVLKILGTLGTVSTLQWYEFKAEEGGILESESHGSGSLENLTLVSGKLLVISGTESRELISGETLRFLTDSPHRLESLGPEPAHGFMVNLLNSNESF